MHALALPCFVQSLGGDAVDAVIDPPLRRLACRPESEIVTMRSRQLLVYACGCVVAGLGGISGGLYGQSASEPIHIIAEVHCDPMWFTDLGLQEELFDEWVAAVHEGLDEAEAHGGRVSFLSTGQFMEWVEERPAAGYPLIQRLYDHGGQIGTHIHGRIQLGPFNWVQANAGTTDQIRRMWDDHIGWVNAVISGALELTDPGDVQAVNNILGTHTPNDDALRLSLMEEYGFVGHEQGPDEQFFAYFDHYAMNPYRPSGENFLKNDVNGPVVVVPFGPVLGLNSVHFGIQQDMRRPAFKARFLMEILNWLYDQHVAGSERVWATGWAAHCNDLITGSSTRAAWEPMIQWLDQYFVGKLVGGHVAAQFSSIRDARDSYLEWEAEHPGQASFDYQPEETDWNEYPYLVAAGQYLARAQHVVDLPAVGPARLHRLESSAESGAFDIYVAYTVHGNPIVIDLADELGRSDIAVVDTNRGTWEVVSTDAVPLYAQGVILVAPEDAIAITMFGDLDADGRISGSDLAFLLGSWGSAGTGDLNGDGLINGADLTLLLGNWSL